MFLQKVKKSKKTLTCILLVMFVLVSGFSQSSEVYNKFQMDFVSKAPTDESKVEFGGFFNEAKALIYFDEFWVEGRIGLRFCSTDGWESGKVQIMSDRTHGNVGWFLGDIAEVVFGTQYYKMLPGTYMNAYDDALPDGRYGKDGYTMLFTPLRDIFGLSMAFNVPLQDDMFTESSLMKVSGSFIYESPFDINFGSTIYTDLKDDISIASFLSGNPRNVFMWMIGYTYNGTGIDGTIPATHYVDSSMKITLPRFELSGDFEIGYNSDTDTTPMYAGLLGIFYPIPSLQTKLGLLYNVSNLTAYEESKNILFIYPRVIISIMNNDISIGPQITIADMPNADSKVGFSFPVYWKCSL